VNEVASRVAEAFHSTPTRRGRRKYASPSVYANLSGAAGCPCEVLGPLYGPHRQGVRLVMILLSARGWTAGAIAELLGCDPSTVRRWTHRFNQHGVAGLLTGPDRAAHAWAAAGSPTASAGCFPSPRRGRSPGCTSGLAVPP
jgi:hypothetical protein